jgi:hypothetical protein
MRVRCTHLIALSGPKRGQPINEHPLTVIGDEFLVVAMLLDPDAPSPWSSALQVLDRDRRPVWRPAAMFETVSNLIPSNWVVETSDAGVIHVGPSPWLVDGFWEAFWQEPGKGPAFETYKTELAIIEAQS